MPWKVSVEGRNGRGTATFSWFRNADDTAPEFVIEREGANDPVEIAAALPIVIAARDEELLRLQRCAEAATSIESAVNAVDTNPPGGA